MPQPSTQDIAAPFDPTAYTTLTSAQLLQYLQGAYPGTAVGFVVTTTDVAGVPQVPDANTNTKWQKYIWQRVLVNSVGLYVWNVGGASDATYLQWTPAFSAAIPAGSLQGYQLANNTVTDANIANVNWSKITNAPTTINSGSAAGGDLTGTYPNPVVGPLAITTSKIAQNAVNGGATGQMGIGANGVDVTENIKVPAASTYASPAGAAAGAPLANDRLVVGVGATAYATVRKVLDALSEPVAGDALKNIQVNAGGTGFQYSTLSTNRILQYVVATSAAKTSSIGNVNTASLPKYGDTGLIDFFNQAFTPLSATSTIIVRAKLTLYANLIGWLVGGIYPANSAGVTVASAFGAVYNAVDTGHTLEVINKLASPGIAAMTFYVQVGTSNGAVHTNSLDGATSVFGGLVSTIEIIEYL